MKEYGESCGKADVALVDSNPYATISSNVKGVEASRMVSTKVVESSPISVLGWVHGPNNYDIIL